MIVKLNILYNNQAVSNFDYSYWDGRTWSTLYSAKNGIGYLEFYGAQAKETTTAKIKAEYVFVNEANYDKELNEVMKQFDTKLFRNCYFDIKIQENEKVEDQQKEQITENNTIAETHLETVDAEVYKNKIELIKTAIKSQNYSSVSSLFTGTGYKIYEELISYGSARILMETELVAVKHQNSVICRSIPMAFSFENNKKFVEDIVFHFNSEGLIENLTFALSKTTENDIIENAAWSAIDKMIIINFLENYKTAYALKRLDYVESIFADDALIITGTKVKITTDFNNPFKDNEIIIYNRQSKSEYIDRLQYSFGSKEYINIKFEDCTIRRGTKDNIYGIQIKQQYFSSNYADSGYLFLMVDLSDRNNPIIHVRTWQPEKNEDGSIYGITNF